ncbi:MAG: hypothetical protein H7336_02285 [Bacteriovorax sp.]|nr:hypothetical protein [Bacteriovorax sp.]
MIEALMCVTLAVMGFYFFKSTDLPKDMKDRSAQLHAESKANPIVLTKRMAFDAKATTEIKTEIKNTIKVLDDNQAAKLAKLEAHKKELEMRQRAQVIDELTLKIIVLEQELKTNNARNAEILAEIDTHMEILARLTSISLS